MSNRQIQHDKTEFIPDNLGNVAAYEPICSEKGAFAGKDEFCILINPAAFLFREVLLTKISVKPHIAYVENGEVIRREKETKTREGSGMEVAD